MSREHSINIQTLYDLVSLKKVVDPWDLTSASEGLYRSVKIVGIEKTKVHFYDENGEKVLWEGTEIPIKMRAIAAFVNTLIYRWNDTNSGRIEQHFGLPMPINFILSDTKIFKYNSVVLPSITVEEVIENYLK